MDVLQQYPIALEFQSDYTHADRVYQAPLWAWVGRLGLSPDARGGRRENLTGNEMINMPTGSVSMNTCTVYVYYSTNTPTNLT